MFQVAILVAALVILAYWRLRPAAGRKGQRRAGPSGGMVLLSLAMVGLLWLMQDDSRWQLQASSPDHVPIALGIVFDTSLSMDAGPDPRMMPEVGTRLDRGKAVVLDVLDRLAEQRREVYSAVTIFTSRAETILHWSRNLNEVGEIIERTIASDLVGRGGTDLGAAMAGGVRKFAALPDRVAGNAEQILLLVSDGEVTVPRVDMQEHLQALRRNGVRIVALHTGLLNTPEGVRMYDAAGTFVGFDRVGGQVFTIPDVDTMMSIAGRDVARGLYLRAEDAQTTARIMRFIGEGAALPPVGEWWAVIGLWLLSLLMLQRILT